MQQILKLRALLRFDNIIGIKPERIIASRARQRNVSGGSEVIRPGLFDSACAEAGRDFLRAVGAAGIDYHQFIEKALHELQATGEVAFLLPDNHR